MTTEMILEPAEHPHHWLIDNQDGPVSKGVCKVCGVGRDFSNGFKRMTGPYMRRPQAAAIETGAESEHETASMD
jgi:hypothetical protein